MDAVRVQAKFIVVTADHCLHPGQMVIRRGRVVELTDRLSEPADIDLGDAVLLPGLVNAHTHLEFSSLEKPFAAGVDFPQWISQVVAYRRSLMESAASPAQQGPLTHLQTALQAGLRESFCSGSVLIGDIVTPPWQASLLPCPRDFARELPSQVVDWVTGRYNLSAAGWQEHMRPLCFPRVVAIHELLGLTAERLSASWQWAQQSTSQSTNEMLVGYGVSPHAPYSIYLPGIEKTLGDKPATTLVAMHVAESPAELEWIAAEKGPFQELFSRLGIVPDAPAPSVDQCIELLSRWQRALLIHGNYLTPLQIRRVARASGITIVFCPRTHAHFGHACYPLDLMREAGVGIALGTDSRASNPDLNLWDELAQAKRLYPQVMGSELFSWITITPARALGLDRDFGSLEPGRLAAACVARVSGHWTADSLLEEMSHCSAAELALAPLCSIVGPGGGG